MPALDHLVFASPNLETGVVHIERLTGVRPVEGGPHPGMGTRNALLGIDPTTYFEIIAVDPEQPDPARPRPFGLDDALPLTLVGFAIHPTGAETIDDVAGRLTQAGFPLGPVLAMSRRKPDGEEIHWKLTFPLGDTGGCIPFVIDWGVTQSPAETLPSMGGLDRLVVSHPDPAVRAAVDGLNLGASIQTVDADISLDAHIQAPSGPVVI